MINYQEMSDYEINCGVAKLISKDGLYSINGHDDFLVHESTDNGLCVGRKKFDPCNSWADAGPIIQENRISLFASDDEGKWMAQFINYKTVHMDKNPLRAAMIVFLMMKGGE